MDFLILTNNPLVRERYAGRFALEYAEVSLRELLVMARDRIHLGHALYTHPLSGSVKPNQTPYKSVLISKQPQEFSPAFAEIIERSIAVCDAFPQQNRIYSEATLADFQLIDFTLLASAMPGEIL